MKYNRRSPPSPKKNLLKRSNLLKAVILLAVLIVSTSCTSVPTVKENDPYRQVLVSMAPEAPTIPVFPTLNWTYQNGLYCIVEADADALLNYGENELPLFAHRYGQYVRQMRLILDALARP
jgi:hypothetical protein